ncbi:MAG: hypothetical protein WAW63_00980 [Candidatus Saccharimonadales bacterium]|jgi:hypothetical protein|nr:hypothetical protein [Candidatus Saccharibacteria bacterium]
MDVGSSRVEMFHEASQIVDWRLSRGEATEVCRTAFERLKTDSPRVAANLILYAELEFGQDPHSRQAYLDSRMREAAIQHVATDLAQFADELLGITQTDLLETV